MSVCLTWSRLMETSVEVVFGSGGADCFGALLFGMERRIGMNMFVERVQGVRVVKAPSPFCETAYTACCAIV